MLIYFNKAKQRGLIFVRVRSAKRQENIHVYDDRPFAFSCSRHGQAVNTEVVCVEFS